MKPNKMDRKFSHAELTKIVGVAPSSVSSTAILKEEALLKVPPEFRSLAEREWLKIRQLKRTK